MEHNRDIIFRDLRKLKAKYGENILTNVINNMSIDNPKLFRTCDKYGMTMEEYGVCRLIKQSITNNRLQHGGEPITIATVVTIVGIVLPLAITAGTVAFEHGGPVASSLASSVVTSAKPLLKNTLSKAADMATQFSHRLSNLLPGLKISADVKPVTTQQVHKVVEVLNGKTNTTTKPIDIINANMTNFATTFLYEISSGNLMEKVLLCFDATKNSKDIAESLFNMIKENNNTSCGAVDNVRGILVKAMREQTLSTDDASVQNFLSLKAENSAEKPVEKMILVILENMISVKRNANAPVTTAADSNSVNNGIPTTVLTGGSCSRHTNL